MSATTDQRVVLISGATDGIGLALAQQYQARGTKLILLGRRAPATLNPTLFTPTSYCRVDLAQPWCSAVVQAFLERQNITALDIVIHNAGVGFYGPVSQQMPASIEELLAVNLWAPIALTHTLLPWLERRQGQLVYISSIAAALPVSDYAVYGASKAALDGFARSLRVELGKRVAVQVLHVGPTRTGMHARSGVPPERINAQRLPPADLVAAQIIRAVEQGRPMATIGLINQLIWLGGRYLGPLLDRIVARRSN